MNAYSLFIVDDEETIRRTLTIALEGKYRVADFPDAESAAAAARVDPPDLVLLDLGLPGMSGIEAIPIFRAIAPEILIVVITAYEDVKRRVRHEGRRIRLRRQAAPYGDPRGEHRQRPRIGPAEKGGPVPPGAVPPGKRPCFIGESQTIQDVMEFVRLVARSPDTPVLIRGGDGDGEGADRGGDPLPEPPLPGPDVSVNCAAIPRELIESELFGYEKGAFSGASAAGKKGLVEQADRRHALPRRGRRLEPRGAGQAARFLEEGEFYRVGGTRVLTVPRASCPPRTRTCGA